MNFDIQQLVYSCGKASKYEMVGVVSLTEEEQLDDNTIVTKLSDMGVIDEEPRTTRFELIKEDLKRKAIYLYEKSEQAEGNPPMYILKAPVK